MSSSDFPALVLQRLTASCEVPPHSRLLLGLSGGADSVALLLALQEAEFDVVAVHCNFGLRGEESRRDERFVRRLCAARRVPLHVVPFDTRREAAATGVSLEMAARTLRYDLFDRLCDEERAVAVVVAHHRGDNAETVLLNLVRGTGLRGLTGMAWRHGKVVRPLLDTPREDLLRFLHARRQTYVVDTTNADTVYKRNKVRHELLPLLRSLNPSIEETLCATAHRLAEAEVYYRRGVAAALQEARLPATGGQRLSLDVLRRLPAVETLLYEWLVPRGFSAQAVADLWRSRRAGVVIESTDGSLATRTADSLDVFDRPVALDATPLTVGATALPDGGRLHCSAPLAAERCAVSRDPLTATLDAATVSGQLYVRSLRPGDRFAPFGMKGTKLVSDYLTDRKRSRIEKLAALVVCDADGIVWLVGERIDRRCAVTDATRTVIRLEKTLLQ